LVANEGKRVFIGSTTQETIHTNDKKEWVVAGRENK
jgi:hypothetical protein